MSLSGFIKTIVTASARRATKAGDLTCLLAIALDVVFSSPGISNEKLTARREFKLGLAVPLLQGRAIDAQRVAVFFFKRTWIVKLQNRKYNRHCWIHTATLPGNNWDCGSLPGRTSCTTRLLDLAVKRGEQFKVGFEAGNLRKLT